jgi:hypothetical protein
MQRRMRFFKKQFIQNEAVSDLYIKVNLGSCRPKLIKNFGRLRKTKRRNKKEKKKNE